MEAEEAPGLDISQNGDGEYRSAVQVLALGVEEAITGSPSIRKILTRAKLRPELIDLRLQGEAFEDAQKILRAAGEGTSDRPSLAAVTSAIAALDDAQAAHEEAIVLEVARLRQAAPTSTSGPSLLPDTNRAVAAASTGMTLSAPPSGIHDPGTRHGWGITQTQPIEIRPAAAGQETSRSNVADIPDNDGGVKVKLVKHDERVDSMELKIDRVLAMMVSLAAPRILSAMLGATFRFIGDVTGRSTRLSEAGTEAAKGDADWVHGYEEKHGYNTMKN